MKYKIKTEPADNNREYYHQQTITFRLPNEIIDLTTFTFVYDALPNVFRHITTATPEYITLNRFMPKLSSGIIDELTIFKGNTIVQKIKSYNYIDCLLNDLTTSDDNEIQRLKTDTVRRRDIYFEAGNVIEVNDPVISSVSRPQAFTGEWFDFISGGVKYTNKDTYFVNKWIGLLGTKYLDARNDNYKIEIKLAPASILYTGFYFTDGGLTVNTTYSEGKYKVLSPYLIYDIYDKPPADAPASASDIVFMDYLIETGIRDGNSKRVSITAETYDPLLYVIGTFLNPYYDRITDLQLAHCNDDITTFGDKFKPSLAGISDINNNFPIKHVYTADYAKTTGELYILNNSIYFDRQGTSVDTASFRYNETNLTPEMNMVDIFNQTKKYLKTDLKHITALCQFEANFFAHIVGVENMAENDLKRIVWNVKQKSGATANSDITGGYPVIILCTVKTL